eukprot:2900151-Pleurochrysis_carterae.AAC.1
MGRVPDIYYRLARAYHYAFRFPKDRSICYKVPLASPPEFTCASQRRASMLARWFMAVAARDNPLPPLSVGVKLTESEAGPGGVAGQLTPFCHDF